MNDVELVRIASIDKEMLAPADISSFLRCDAHTIRIQAHTNPAKLGFPVVVMKSRVKIPKKRFLEFFGYNFTTN